MPSGEGGAEVQSLLEGARHRRIRLPDHFVDPVIIEQVVAVDEVCLLTVRTRSGVLE
jgi:hypothetical protein